MKKILLTVVVALSSVVINAQTYYQDVKNPEMYRGVITQFYKGLRLLLTHQEHGIAMDDIILVLGHDEVIRRLELEL